MSENTALEQAKQFLAQSEKHMISDRAAAAARAAQAQAAALIALVELLQETTVQSEVGRAVVTCQIET